MTKQKVLKIILWIMVIFSAALIFFFSAQDATASNDTSGGFVRALFGLFPAFRNMTAAAQTELVESVMYVVRKCAHFCIYAFFGFWLMHLARQYSRQRAIVVTVITAMAYAASDELHQYFVPGRSCGILDVCIDTAGALVGALVAMIFAFIWQKLRKLYGSTM